MASGGRNSPVAAVLDTADGAVFVKGIPVDQRGAATQAREAAMAPHVTKVAPTLLRHLPDAAGWNVLGFEYVEGRHADYAPGSPDLAAVVELLERVGGIDCPDDAPTRDTRRTFASYMDDPEAAGLLGGTALPHTDYNPENVLIGPDGGARLVDWAWPCRGAAWIDPCVLIVRLIAAGHTPQAAEACSVLAAAGSGWQRRGGAQTEQTAAPSVRAVRTHQGHAGRSAPVRLTVGCPPSRTWPGCCLWWCSSGSLLGCLHLTTPRERPRTHQRYCIRALCGSS